MKDTTPWSGVKLVTSLSVRVREYDNGENRSDLLIWDRASNQMVTQEIAAVEQPDRDPFTLEELVLMAALEVYARRVDPQMQLPW